MLRSMRDQGPAITPKDIAQLEANIGMVLPRDYRQFLLRYNGGAPDPGCVPVINMPLNALLPVQRFFGINQDLECYELAWCYNILRDRVGPTGLPIACSGIEQDFCLYLKGRRQGQVWVWDQASAWGRDPSSVPMYKCADSFAEFIESLQDGSALPTSEP